MKKGNYDFGGWATKNDLLCADGRTIRKNAFKDDDGRTVPLVWQHNHDDPTRVIGHVLLENEDEGVYAYGTFNNTDIAQHVKELVRHGDVNGLSIYANKLKQNGGDVLHGVIREVSVVLAGANPGALIEFPIMEHGEVSETEAVIWSGEEELHMGSGMKLRHEEKEEDEEETEEKAEEALKEEPKEEPKEEKSEKKEEEPEMKHAEEAANSNETVQDVLNTLTEEQRNVLEFLVGKALGGDDEEEDEEAEDVSHADGDDGRTVEDVINTLSEKQRKVFEFVIAKAMEAKEENGVSHSIEEGEETTMKKNVFENDQTNDRSNGTLSHADMDVIMKDAKRLGSLKASVLEHTEIVSEGEELVYGPYNYGVEYFDYIMPEYKEASGNGAPQFITRDQNWVSRVMRGVHHIPFSKFKTTFADLTEDEARARGYITATRKKDEVFTLLRRTTDATTVYKKQKLDRDNAIEITGFDIVAWLKGEMRMMLDEELARAFLIGDGRDPSSDDKINELNIRPVFKDDSLFVIRQPLVVGENQPRADALIDAVTYGWEEYKGSGNCIAFMTRREFSGLKLLKDRMGRRMYETDAAIASALGVKAIEFVPQMGDDSTVYTDATTNKTYKPAVIILDLADYTVGADKGGAVSMFDDFDIDYNQMKYLIETRCSAALVKPYSAIVVMEEVEAEDDGEDDGDNP